MWATVRCGCAPIPSRSIPTCSRARYARRAWRPPSVSCSSGAASSCWCGSTGSTCQRTSCAAFWAFDRFLELHPEFEGRITFLARLQPSREDVEEYVAYREHVLHLAAEINTRHGSADWLPIDLRLEDNFPATLAAYKHYDALMVNAIFDGMNLVAKEGRWSTRGTAR